MRDIRGTFQNSVRAPAGKPWSALMAFYYSDSESRIQQAVEYGRRAETARRVASAAKREDVGKMFLSVASHYETLALIAERWIDAQRPKAVSLVTQRANSS